MGSTEYDEILTSVGRPMAVLAGPGAGKTYLLADRLRWLLGQGAKKQEITILTFARDASRNMREKLIDPTGDFRMDPGHLPRISTMHSLGLQIVKRDPHSVNLLKTNLKVQDSDDVKKLMYRDAALILGFTEHDGRDALECKECGDCQQDSDERKCAICEKYWQIMSKCNRLDFDDQILFACRVLKKNPKMLQEYQSHAKHLLVDEYQDINAAQYRFIKLLSERSRGGLLVVGDDAQSIYEFRGASPTHILAFDEAFSDGVVRRLPYSRRCHERIMEEAFKVLEKHYTEWSGTPELNYLVEPGEEPHIWQFPSELAEAKMVATIARRSIPEKSVLILAPRAGCFAPISRKLSQYGVPHGCPVALVPQGTKDRMAVAKRFAEWTVSQSDSFLTRLVIEDLINIGIAKVPGAKKDKRCSPETIAYRIEQETEVARLWEHVDKRNDLFSVIRSLHTDNETLRKIRHALVSLTDAYADFKGDSQGEFAKRLSVVTGMWTDPSKLADDIRNIAILMESQSPAGAGSVQLKTMRKAKGLEADIVIVVALEDDMVPTTSSNVAEEARLFYVAMTRAKHDLYLFHAFSRPRNYSYGEVRMDKPRSRFLDAIGRESEYKPTKKRA